MPGSSIWASSTQQTPPEKDLAAEVAAASASRVFPVPPGPVRVSRRLRARACTMSPSSLSRPTSGVRRTGSDCFTSDAMLPPCLVTGTPTQNLALVAIFSRGATAQVHRDLATSWDVIHRRSFAASGQVTWRHG